MRDVLREQLHRHGDGRRRDDGRARVLEDHADEIAHVDVVVQDQDTQARERTRPSERRPT